MSALGLARVVHLARRGGQRECSLEGALTVWEICLDMIIRQVLVMFGSRNLHFVPHYIL